MVKHPRGATDDVEMPVGDWIETAWINRNGAHNLLNLLQPYFWQFGNAIFSLKHSLGAVISSPANSRNVLVRKEITMSPLQSLISAGTKLWLDSVDPEFVRQNKEMGATGATSNPIIIADLIKTGRFDRELGALVKQRLTDDDIAWKLTDLLVAQAEEIFKPVWRTTNGNDGFVSFEVDPLIEDPQSGFTHGQRVRRYMELGQLWCQGHENRLIKVPATAAGLDAMETLAAAGVNLNVTLIFTMRQYEAARANIWRGAQRLGDLRRFKSVYSIFISRVDVYTEKYVPQLSAAAQGLVGIVNAKRMWAENQRFWQEHVTPLQQEIVFASTGTKKPSDPPDKYVEALAGSDIQTNPPATNDAAERSGKVYSRQVDRLPPQTVLNEIDQKVDMAKLEQVLVEEGIAKFVNPQKALLQLIAEKRQQIETITSQKGSPPR
jgi:transaldolase